MNSIHNLLRFVSSHLVNEGVEGIGQPLGGVLCHLDRADGNIEDTLLLCRERPREQSGPATSSKSRHWEGEVCMCVKAAMLDQVTSRLV